MKIIALEEHFVPRRVSDAWAATAEIQDLTVSIDTNRYAKQLEDLADIRLASMVASGIDVQVLSLPSPGVQNFEPAESVSVAVDFNDILAASIAHHPNHFDGFATLPAPAPAATAKELERAVLQLGLKGALLNGRVRNRNMDHHDFEPIYEAAASLRAPLYLHPQLPSQGVREAYYAGVSPVADLMLAMGAVGWHGETGLQLLRMVLADVFDRHPDLQVIVGHWGEVVLFYLDRISQLDHAGLNLQRPLREYFQHNVFYTPSGIFSTSYLSRTIEIVGVGRLMFSQDWPYQSSVDGGAYLPRTGMPSTIHQGGDRAWYLGTACQRHPEDLILVSTGLCPQATQPESRNHANDRRSANPAQRRTTHPATNFCLRCGLHPRRQG